MHWVIASLVPDMVTVLSVELGSISEATWIDAPVTSRISLILEPPLPMSEPHWDAGTMSLRVIGGLGTPVPPPPPPWESWNCEHHSSNFLQIRVNALKMEFVGPVTVTIRSGHEPSEMFILAPDCWKKKVNLVYFVCGMIENIYLRGREGWWQLTITVKWYGKLTIVIQLEVLINRKRERERIMRLNILL